MEAVSRLQAIFPPSPESGRRPAQVIRVIVDEKTGVDLSRIALSPGDRLLVENRSARTLRVAPIDFFGTAFGRFALEPGEATSPMVVTGLWFQVELMADGGRVYPLDVFLTPNTSA